MSMRGDRDAWLIEQYCERVMTGLDNYLTAHDGDDYWRDPEEDELERTYSTGGICDACQLGEHGHCRGPRWWRPQGCQCKNPDCEEWNQEALRVERRINDRNK